MVITGLRNPSPGSEFQITEPPGLLAEAVTGTEGRGRGQGGGPFCWGGGASEEIDEITDSL